MISKEVLLTKRPIPERDVDVPGIGTVRVRSLTRAEVFSMQGTTDVAALEAKMLAAAMLDPVLTEDEAKQWAASCPAGEIDPVTNAITELSGMGVGADKAAMRTFRD